MIDFLKDLGIDEATIYDITNTYSSSVLYSLNCNRFEIKKIISYFKEIGINNIDEILLDNINFFFKTLNDVKNAFNKYEINSLVNTINTNPEVLNKIEL